MAQPKQSVDREAIKTLATAVGVREAARQLGLNEDTVCSWAKRGNWFKNTIVAQPPAQAINPQALQAKPSDALANALADDNRETKLSLSRSIRKGAKALEEMPDIVAFTGADKLKHLVGAAAQVHQWDAKADAGVNLNILSIGGDMALQINAGVPRLEQD